MARLIDFRSLLDEHRIPYVERGPNVKRGNMNIQCPFCGASDPSFHMGLDPENGNWACWRNESHRGKSPVRLLVKLLRIPYWQAREMAGLTEDYVDPDGFSTVLQRLRSSGFNPEARGMPQEDRFLGFPRSFRPITSSVACERYVDYLADVRGFGRDALDVAFEYQLMCDPMGDWSHRVIFPYFLDRALVTWTGRAIGRSELRYRDLSLDDSLVPPKHTLYNHDVLLEGGKWLICVEGPVDAVKLDYYGKPYGVRAVALSTNSLQDDQLHIIADSWGKFQRLGAMMDNAGAVSLVDSMRMRQNLHFVDASAQMFRPPGGAKDAGAATPRDIINFCKEIA